MLQSHQTRQKDGNLFVCRRSTRLRATTTSVSPIQWWNSTSIRHSTPPLTLGVKVDFDGIRFLAGKGGDAHLAIAVAFALADPGGFEAHVDGGGE
jgi:hypothetical protein